MADTNTMIRFTLDGEALCVAQGTTFEEVTQNEVKPGRTLAVRIGGRTFALTEPIPDGCNASTVNYAHTEGRRLYERSLRFILLLALHELHPDADLRIENSIGNGIYMTLENIDKLNNTTVRKIEARMREIVARNLPFVRHTLSKERAIEYFKEHHMIDKVRLLSHRSLDYFHLYSCGDMQEYFYGIMAPSTDYIPVFQLKFYMPGMVLMLPESDQPDKVSPFRDQPKLMRCYAESARWSDILGCANVADLNHMIAGGQLREFIRVNEALHQRSIFEMAEQFQKSDARLILIAGPSSSGKTTFSNRLSIALRVLGLKPVSISLDDYYIDRDKVPLEPDGSRDLERLETLNIDLFNEHMVQLLQGERVQLPWFDFKQGRSMPDGKLLQLDVQHPLIIEGIHGLNDELTSSIPSELKFKIYISSLTTLNLDNHNRIRTTDARLIRRMVRDHHFRGTTIAQTLEMWSSVRRGEEKYIFPYQENADVLFNSSLVYELSILKRHVYPLLLEISKDHRQYTAAQRIVKFLNYFKTADAEDEVPTNSILREFIGGSCFEH